MSVLQSTAIDRNKIRVPINQRPPITHQELTALLQINADLLAALQSFVEQATKVSGFPQAYEPYVGALVVARAAIARATGQG